MSTSGGYECLTCEFIVPRYKVVTERCGKKSFLFFVIKNVFCLTRLTGYWLVTYTVKVLFLLVCMWPGWKGLCTCHGTHMAARDQLSKVSSLSAFAWAVHPAQVTRLALWVASPVPVHWAILQPRKIVRIVIFLSFKRWVLLSYPGWPKLIGSNNPPSLLCSWRSYTVMSSSIKLLLLVIIILDFLRQSLLL